MSKLSEWDSESLERAAKSLRELDKSVNAKAALELAKRDQDVEVARLKAEAEKAATSRAHAENEFRRSEYEERQKMARIKGEEDRKTLESRHHQDKVRRVRVCEASGYTASSVQSFTAPAPPTCPQCLESHAPGLPSPSLSCLSPSLKSTTTMTSGVSS